MKRRSFIQKNALGALFLGSSLTSFSSIKNVGIENRQKLNAYVEKHEYDVIVCGGGPAGFAAALASARTGVRTALIEMQGCLGGIWTSGLMNELLDFVNKKGIMQELMGEIKNRGASVFPYVFDPENMKLILEEMCLKAGVSLRYYTRVARADVEGGKLKRIVTISNSGEELWEAKTFVDATGNGDLAAFSGCEFHIGHPVTGKVQPMTLRVIIKGLNFEVLKDNSFISESGLQTTEMKIAFRNEIEKGGVTPSYSMPSLMYIRDDLYGLMANHEYGVSALDAGEMTGATIRARRENNDIIDALKKQGGIWENIQLVATGHQIGIREARRIIGRYYLTADDLQSGAEFHDGICTVTYWADIHSLDSKYGESYSDGGVKVKPYQIPLRSLIARDVDGLLMAGRCISGDFFAHASYRVTGNVVPMGEAAGKCAALAVLNNILPQEVNVSTIK